MKKTAVAFIIILSLVLLFSACSGGETMEEPEVLEYDIIIDELIDIYIWENVHQITPKLIDNHGKTVSSRFEYQISGSDIEISYDGYITINNVPDEPLTVTIFEKNTSTSKTIQLNFVSDFSKVQAITRVDGSRVENLNGMVLTEEVVLNVVTDQRNIKIKDFMFIKVTDSNGNEKNAFEFSFDKSNVTIKPIGIGAGDIYIEISNAAGDKLHSSTIPFSISMKESTLSNSILDRENIELLSREELDMVDDIVVDSSVKSLAETQYMSALKTVIIEGTELLVFDSAPMDCFYRVKDSLYVNYYENSAYSAVKECIIPYKNSYDERYAVYHSAKGEAFSFGMISSDMKFPIKTSHGYTNVGWMYQNKRVTESELNGMNEAIVHLDAVWEANENQLIFVGNGSTSGQMDNQIIRSDESENLSKNGFVKAGYSFVGWSTAANGSVVYKDQTVYNMGLDESYTLYAIWEANINTLKFNANGGEGSMTSMQIASDAKAVLSVNAFARKGYNFVGWSDKKDGTVVYNDKSEYTMGTNSSYEIFAIWAPIEYTISYKLDGGNISKDAVTKYTIESGEIKLLSPTSTKHQFLGWIGEGIEVPQIEVKITPTVDNLKNLEYTAVWGARIVFMPNETEGEQIEQVIPINSTTYNLLENTFTRPGYTFIGWSSSPTGGKVEYKDGDLYNCGGEGMYYLYAVWFEGTPGLTYSGSEVIGYNGTYTDVIIPSQNNGKKITSISYSAFRGNTSITSIEMSGEIVKLGDAFLRGCSGLKILKVPALSGKVFGSYFGTSSYTGGIAVVQNDKTYYIPETLRTVTVTGTQVPKGFFENCTGVIGVTFDVGITEIGEKAFANCTGIRSITLPEGVKRIGDYAFANCTNLDMVVLPSSLEYIGKNAFEGCTSLTKVLLRGNNTTISDYAFADCGKLDFFFVSGNIASIGECAFRDCVSLPEFTFSELTTTVGEYAFFGCANMTSIKIKGITNFAETAFVGCASLKSIIVSETVTDFDASAFNSKAFTVYDGAYYVGNADNPYMILVGVASKSIERCTIANGTKIINTGAFAGCDKLKTITIPASVTTIKERAFEGCTALNAVNITDVDAWCRIKYVYGEDAPTDVKIMNPLYYAHSLYINGNPVTHVDIPSDVVYINEYIFQGCTSIESITFHNAILTIGKAAFWGCSNLKSLTIPVNISLISENAFTECSSVKEVVFEGITSCGVFRNGTYIKLEWKSTEDAAKMLTKDYASYRWYK